MSARLRKIVAVIAEKYGVSYGDIARAWRWRPATWARHEAFYTLRELDRSCTEIGVMLNCHHTTVLYGAKKHKERLARGAIFRRPKRKYKFRLRHEAEHQ